MQRLAVMGRIAVGVAHDLNNLLTVVLACSDSLLLDLDPSDPRAEEVGDIWRAARVGASLTRRLLAIGRKRSAGPSVVKPAVVVDECEALLRRLVGPSVRLTVHVAPDAGSVLAEEGELEQVIMNLAANARDAMPRGGSLELEIANVDVNDDDKLEREVDGIPRDRYVMLVMRDTGTGISDDVLARIFEPFFTTKQTVDATGLGLAFVHTIVTERGGAIRVRSNPGVGTTFRVYLPRVLGPFLEGGQAVDHRGCLT
jgi:signal transduction histidine kinase